jgi:hypothetical protein
VLAACGAGLTALAGCSVDVSVGEDDGPEYDGAALRAIPEEQPVPPRPDAFPVRVDDTLVERHYDRARELVGAVPERPDVPNGAVAERLHERRARVAGRLDERSDAPTGPRRLAAARRVRGDAAEVNGAYRAATGDVTRERVEDRREVLRSDLRAFESEWTYRGGEPAPALVFHAELEELVRAARRNAEAWPPLADDPRDDVFRAGEVCGNVEAGWAALGDAYRLRRRYLEEASDPSSYRSAVTVAAHRLDRRASMERRRVDDFLDVPAPEAFERDVEETPAAVLYEEARRYVRFADEDAESAREAGEHATATLRGAGELATLRTFGTSIDAIRAGEYGRPEGTEPVTTAGEEAVAALREAWTTEPAGVSAEVAGRARESLASGHSRLEHADGQSFEVDDALAAFAFTRLYAEAVPGVVAAVVDALGEDG